MRVAGGIASLLAAAMMAIPWPAMSGEQGPEWQAWKQWTTRDGLPHAWVLALHQDREGSIIAGTAAGAARFDGQEWEILDLPQSMQQAAIGTLAEDADGRLWFGSDRAGAWRTTTEDHVERVPLPAGASTVHVLVWVGDAMLVGSNLGLYRCAADCQPVWPGFAVPIRSMLLEPESDRERLWLGTQGEGLWVAGRRDGADFELPQRVVDKAGGLPNDIVLALARFDNDEALWVGTGRGIARWDGEQLLPFADQENLPVAMVFGFAAASALSGDPIVLAAMRPGGMLEFEGPATWRIHDTRRGFPAQSVQAMLRERYRGALWLGSFGGGVLRAEAGRWTILDEQIGLPDRVVTGVGHTDGRLWVGTPTGAVIWKDGAFAALAPGLDPAPVHDVVTTDAGERWIATARGVHRFGRDGSHRHYTVDNSALPGVAVQRLALGADATGEQVYLATSHGLARWSAASDQIERVRGDEAWLADASVLDLSSSRGRVAVSNMNGVGVIAGEQWWRLPADCLGGDIAAAVALLDDGGLVASLRNGDLVGVWDRQCVTLGDVRAIGAVSRLLVDGDGLIAFGARGAERLTLAQRRLGARRTRYGPEDGLVHGDVVAATRDAMGRIYTATSGGIQAFDPRQPASPRPSGVAPLAITRASYGDPPQTLRAGMTLPAGTDTVAFAYRLRSFEREHLHRYRVRLDGLDAADTAWSPDARVRYERLPPGAYTLRVEATDADGQTAEPVAFGFEIEAHWWQQRWLQLLVAVLLVFAGAQIGRWRVARATRRAEALEAEVERRTRDLAVANARLAELATTDALTGLPNRRYYSAIESDLARRERVLVGLVDIDHFKRINDTFGHDGGDAVLARVAAVLAGAVGPEGHVLRWGGEEFLVLWPDVEATAEIPLVLGLLDAVAGVSLPDGGPVSVSCGFDWYRREGGPTGSDDLARVMARADTALYQAKQGGRDRAVLLAGPVARTLRRGDDDPVVA